MPSSRKMNLPLMEAAGVAILLHIVGLVVLGSVTLYRYTRPPQTEFAAPPPMERIEPEKLEYEVQVKQHQQQSSRPRQQRLTVTAVGDLSLPEMDLNLVPVTPQVSVNAAGARTGGGLGSAFGRTGIGFGTSAVNFFGIKAQGERIVFIVDASKNMLVDEKGGIPAYAIVKEELVRLVQALSPGTLFNVMIYSGDRINAFAETTVPATTATKGRVADWVAPINTSLEVAGRVSNNVTITGSYPPVGGDIEKWPRAVQAAMEMGVDSVFLLVSGWQWHNRTPTPEEEAEAARRRDRDGWDERDEEDLQEAYAETREWLEEENRRRAERGLPPKVVVNFRSLVEEVVDDVEFRPSDGLRRRYNAEEVIETLSTMRREIAQEREEGRPDVHVVLFLGVDQKDDPDENRVVRYFKEYTRTSGGKFRILQGLAALENVSDR